MKSQLKGLVMGLKDVENELIQHIESVRSDEKLSKKLTREDELFYEALQFFFNKAKNDYKK